VTAENPAPPAKKKPSLIRSSAIFSGVTLISRFMGLARDLVLTAKMGASATIVADAYNAAYAFPNLFRRIFAEGAFTAAFVPTYAKVMQLEGERTADELASDAMATLAAITIALTIVFQLSMPWLMYVISPGFADDPAKFRLAVILTQITMPYLPCMTIVALLSGVLNQRDRFILSAAAPVALNAVTLLVILPTHNEMSAAYAASIGVVVAGIVQVLWLWWGVRRAGARIVVRRPRMTPEIRALMTKALPGAFAASATQINIFVSQNQSSQVAGARSWMTVADRFYQLPLGMVGVAIGVALLPRLSQAIARDDHDDARAATDQAVVFAMALTLPAVAAMTCAPFYLVDGLYTRGLFTEYDSRQTAAILFWYGLATPAFVLNRLLAPAFFARGDTRGPMKFALIQVAVNLALGLALFFVMGVPGLAAATAVAAWVNVVQMAVRLHRRGDYKTSDRARGKLVRILAANGVLVVLLLAASHFRPQIQGLFDGVNFAGFHAKEVSIILLTLLIAALYPGLLFATGGITPAELKAAFRRKRSDPPGEVLPPV